MAIKDNINDPEVWREAIFKGMLCWVIIVIAMQCMFHFTTVYDTPPEEQLYFSLGVAFGNFLMSFVKPQCKN
jgi:hypothetical protein